MANEPGKTAPSAEKPATPPSPIKVILADTQAIFRVGIRKIFAL